jgi:hypothetical protein
MTKAKRTGGVAQVIEACLTSAKSLVQTQYHQKKGWQDGDEMIPPGWYSSSWTYLTPNLLNDCK